MASQTGTLKFRQSDGTYTELYPKTTIAQVDGLQTQLNNINASLQNKVDYNMTKDIHMTANYFSLDSFYYGVYLGFANEEKEIQGAISVSNNEDTAYRVKPLFVDYTTSKATVIATIEDINNAITGAINASY